jgi:hypothetical protein
MPSAPVELFVAAQSATFGIWIHSQFFGNPCPKFLVYLTPFLGGPILATLPVISGFALILGVMWEQRQIRRSMTLILFLYWSFIAVYSLIALVVYQCKTAGLLSYFLFALWTGWCHISLKKKAL